MSNGRSQRSVRTFSSTVLLAVVAVALPAQLLAQYVPDPGCTASQAWMMQADTRSDVTGKNNIDYPLEQATYWTTLLTGSNRDTITIHGQFAAARYIAIQVYDYNRNVIDAIRDVDIDPDPGQVNPYRPGGGNTQGTYTVQLVFGRTPLRGRAPNTIYTGTTQSVLLLYRIYYANNRNDVAGGATNPALPTIVNAAGVTMDTCPPRPFVLPQTSTVWGRLDQNNFVGVKPASTMSAFNPPTWLMQATNGTTPYFPSQDNSYMFAMLSRRYLASPYRNDLAVMRMRAPTYADTQSGVPTYADTNVRLWAVCSDEPVTTGVTRCITDDKATNVNGFVTFVFSDPNKKPSADDLQRWGANWIAWGALAPGDTVFDDYGNQLTNSSGVFYYNAVLYRQTVTNPSFGPSIANAAQLPAQQAKAAMGDYYPQIGYCSLSDFQSLGAGCLGTSQSGSR